MKLFGKKREVKSSCRGGSCASEAVQKAEGGKQEQGIKILGSGCAKCIGLENAARTAIAELQLDYGIDHITDFAQIASYGVMSTPALVLNGKVVSCGKVLSVEEVKNILRRSENELF